MRNCSEKFFKSVAQASRLCWLWVRTAHSAKNRIKLQFRYLGGKAATPHPTAISQQ
jgi:hypothetical protein